MENIKLKILDQAKKLFNDKGVSNVSIREIAREIGISHSNLIYHFKDKNLLLTHLHQQILDAAVEINREISKEENTLKSVFISTVKGFKIIYDFRFFMIDFNSILLENKELHQQIKEIEAFRYNLYEVKIAKMIDEEIFRNEVYKNEYADLISQIRIFSDYWVSSSQVYEQYPQSSIKKYARLFLCHFRPFLTPKGHKMFIQLLSEFEL
ncbi:TetR/AcrR family transcriptional regulator [Flavobacterium piscinae]|uniref:TetR/AcrR family transcriptional regulator n=1 Tax=Flavobacterium piscinae TaxID=2506424 RepID=A0A4Q1KI16_9FLAO|nr:TetR/AcrR family transcriptional regulator [Flavobacterium piscinae]MBC8883074.1 TetR/AcrR family transcriptional regulator [Flavobacterium piscinae]RXR29428.1 TetR/AcrR family transcriptional regulator [Flavobacterium piscinae]